MLYEVITIAANGQVSITAAGVAAGVENNDFETGLNSFTYGIEARDAAGNWSAAEDITLNVTDVDDTAPVVTAGQNLYYAENQSAGDLIGFVAVITSYSIHYTKLYETSS